MQITQGDNGIVFPFETNFNITDSIINVIIKRDGEIINKVANVIDEINGKCEFILNSSDLTIFGNYKYQWTVNYNDGRIRSCKPIDFYVNEKLTNTSNDTIIVVIDGGDLG